jgi:Tfp pilus assembly protein PilF
MRLTPIALAAAITFGTIGSAGYGQRPDDQIDPRSVQWMEQGLAHTKAGRLDQARDALETALAIDPRNRNAFIGLARVAQAQTLPGKAVKFYAEALKIEPNDANALAGQGEALVQRGAVDRAKRNLERLRTVCKDPCTPAQTLAAAIAKGPPPEVQTAQAPSVEAPRNDN